MTEAPETVTIPRRFHGPSDSGNGGWSAGAAARVVGAPAVESTLRVPPPLETPLTVERSDGTVRLMDGETLVIEARPAPEVPRPPPLVPLDEVGASDLSPDDVAQWTVFPTCFTCGPHREPGDGLRLFPGPAGPPGSVATTWVPHESTAGEDGAVTPEVVWAALDCPGYFAHRHRMLPAVLGRLTAQIHTSAASGEELVVVARDDGKEGRKMHSSSALYRPDGELVAAAQAVWIELRA